MLTEAEHGGSWRTRAGDEGSWAAILPPGPIADTYGCGDAFAAGVTFGLSTGASVDEACGIGARWGAEMLTRVGAP